ncbi:hypothetical protein TVA88_16765 [Aeromonas hydrophila]|uniref:hypothetical protein n=1 Tax=Aeromonas hydrophila TaxID=644 RepID=UPI000575577F|nr:hypothetical protein [Aeromonas hydrophila]KHN57618.1 hypothetical protein OI72_10440 [Aeromonas hydrophila]OFC47353.1 hypothetical protein BA189_09375 [Aeromonas hydrophila]OFC50797.1 hypothetical protein BA188_02485 [Aeromonas hydrophila]
MADGLSKKVQVEEFADSITGSADAIHQRLISAIENKEVEQNTANLIFQNEVMLRQGANSLYIDAINCIVNELAESQKDIINLIETANNKIENIKKISSFIDLIADLLVLVSAAYAAKPAPILAALREVKEDIDALDT